MKEVFALAGNSEMAAAEKRYLSAKAVEVQAAVCGYRPEAVDLPNITKVMN